jgi:threonine dehydrogenase-like Zn-dependent dehydrogenase
VQKRLPWACPIETKAGRGKCHNAVVLGAGPVGLLGAMALAVGGFNVYVYSREVAPNPKSQLVEAIGAQYVSAQTTSIEQLAEKVGNIDAVYEATGASNVSFEMIKVIGTNAIFVFTGVPGRKAPIEVDTDLIMRDLVLKNQVVFGTVNAGRETFEDAIRDIGVFMERWPAVTRSLITGRNPMSAYRDLLLGAPRGIKETIALS